MGDRQVWETSDPKEFSTPSTTDIAYSVVLGETTILPFDSINYPLFVNFPL